MRYGAAGNRSPWLLLEAVGWIVEGDAYKLLEISLDLPDAAVSVPVCRRAIRTILQELAVDPVRAQDIETALGEAAGNVVRHAYETPGNRYQVTVIVYRDCVTLQVRDYGCGFDRGGISAPDADQIGGWGLWLIEQMSDRAAFRPARDHGALLEAQFRLTPPLALPREPPSGELRE